MAEPTRPTEEPLEEDLDEGGPKSKKPKSSDPGAAKKAEWFSEDLEKTTKVYVSNLPGGTTEEEFIEFMSKCGMIDIDVRTNKPKIKLYRDADGDIKGEKEKNKEKDNFFSLSFFFHYYVSLLPKI